MVWALRCIDQQATLSIVPVLTAGLTVEVEVKFDNFDNSYNCVFSNSQSNPFADDCFAIGARSDGKPFVQMGGASGRYIAGASALSTGVTYRIKAVFASLNQTPPGAGGGTMELFVDDVSVATGTPNSAPMHNASRSITYMGNPAASRSFDGYLYSAKITGDTYDYQWSADASSHAAGTPTLVSTVDTNDFVGNNLPTDGSAWIEEGGDVTAPAWSVVPALSATTSVGHSFGQTITDASGSGTVYGVMLPAGATAPNAAQIVAGTDGNGAAAVQDQNVAATSGVNCTLTFNGGSPGTSYDYYFIAQDATPNLMANGEVKSVLGQLTSGATLAITGGVLQPGQTANGTYSVIANLARVVITDSQGNTLDSDVQGGPTIVDNGGGTFSITMPTLPLSGSKNLLLLGTVTLVGYAA